MSDDYQVLAFDSIEEEAGQDVANQAIRWMISRGFICEALSECAMASKGGLGHRPGPRWRSVVDESEEQRRWNVWSARTGRPAPNASETLNDFLSLATNGVEASGRRSVEYAGENCRPVSEGICPTCSRKCEPPFAMGELAGRWWRREICEIECPHCLVRSKLEDWDWQPDWAFAAASVTFWNWPPISGHMVAQLSEALGGPRIRRIDGRL